VENVLRLELHELLKQVEPVRGNDRPTDQPIEAASFHQITVVVCTRNRPDSLRRTLRSLQSQTDSDFDLLVIDNGPESKSTAKVFDDLQMPRSRYVAETRRGLSIARNTGLDNVLTNRVAWIDDDEVADENWIKSLKLGFSHPSKPAAVCGLMLPAELETEAQIRFEQYGGFNKGRGLAYEVISIPSTIPLYPLPAVGSGGNMAFRMDVFSKVGHFDRHLGAGTRTHGGEETKLFASLLSSGEVILHWPSAITWHFHRQEMSELHHQFYGYSAGLTAFWASMVRSEPSVLWELLKLMPRAFTEYRQKGEGATSEELPLDFPKSLFKSSQKGLAGGAFAYMYETLRRET
jgi:glycosyltransferase involved in cell wall biosynthesis